MKHVIGLHTMEPCLGFREFGTAWAKFCVLDFERDSTDLYIVDGGGVFCSVTLLKTLELKLDMINPRIVKYIGSFASWSSAGASWDRDRLFDFASGSPGSTLIREGWIYIWMTSAL